MKLAIFGATGGTGRHLIEQALAQGHEVTAFARDPARLGDAAARVRAVRGDALDAAAVAGQQAVLSCLGVTGRSPVTVCSQGTAHILAAMERHGVRRIVCESAYGAGETREWAPYSRWLRLGIRARLEDKERMEAMLRESGLDWVVARPTMLTDGPRTGRYREAVELRLGWFPKISRADTAEFMLRMVGEDRFLRQAAVVTY